MKSKIIETKMNCGSKFNMFVLKEVVNKHYGIE